MLIQPRGKNRPFHLGPFPLETLLRDESVADREAAQPKASAARGGRTRGAVGAGGGALPRIIRQVRRRHAGAATGARCPTTSPAASADIKGAAYFLDASQVGICRMPENGWLAGGDHPTHGFAAVILVERPRLPEPDNLAREWIAPARVEIADMRAAEIAVCVAGHIRAMGFAARAHFAGNSLVDAERLAVLAGLPCAATSGCATLISTISPSRSSPPTTNSRSTRRCTRTP